MTEQTKEKIHIIMDEVIRAVNGLRIKLEDLQFEAETDYVAADDLSSLLKMDDKLTARIDNAFSLNNQIDIWYENTNTVIENDSINPENEKEFLTALSTQSDNFLNLINNI